MIAVWTALGRHPWLATGALLAAFLTLITGLAIYEHARSPGRETVRKLLHVGSGVLTLSFPFLFGELWPVLLLTASSAALLGATKCLAPLRRAFGGVVTGVERTTFGEIYFPLSVASVFWLSRGKSPLLFCIPILVLTFADAMGAIVGTRFGRHRWSGARKSVEGSVAFAAVAFVCILVPLRAWSGAGSGETLLIGAVLALLLMLVEGVASRGLDNLFVPIGGFLLLQSSLDRDGGTLLVQLVAVLTLVGVAFGARRMTTCEGA